MKRIVRSLPVTLNQIPLESLLNWASKDEDVVWLDSNSSRKGVKYQALLAIGAHRTLEINKGNAFAQLSDFRKNISDWIVGYLGYELKDELELLSSSHSDRLGFSDLRFFQPRKLILFKEDGIDFLYLPYLSVELEEDLHRFTNWLTRIEPPAGVIGSNQKSLVQIKLRMSKDEYRQRAEKMLAHIHRGDIYEANFCQEFYAEDTLINPVQTFLHLNKISVPPFASFFRCADKYLLCASPERYLLKEGDHVISQPIKGTARRGITPEEDMRIMTELRQNEKERSENIMIVDLVRNDLSRVATKGTVKVEELCGLYSFKQVHQLISTISCEVPEDLDPIEVIKATFPMGSMTGAPKVKAMELIEKLETSKRSLYSGTIGYFTPNGDMDFNVIIRSILYNETRKYVSYTVGSALTSQADPLMEYEECLVKAKAMREALEETFEETL